MNFQWFNKKVKPFVTDFICCLFIILFIYASFSKFLEFQQFNIQLAKSSMLTFFSAWVTRIVPAIEILVAILLVVKRFQLFGL
jgi:hypothetical protein